MTERLTTDSRSPRDSQQRLAMSIARAVQLGLPAPDSEEAIRESVRDALRTEACHNETALAQLRVLILGAAILLTAAMHLWPGGFGFARYPLYPLVLALAWEAVAMALFIALRGGWYDRRLRWATPVLDAVVVVTGSWAHLTGLRETFGEPPVGSLGIVAAACSLVTFSGALRLSRKAAQAATTTAILAWAAVAISARVPWITIGVVAGAIGTIGYLTTRVTRVIRRVITDEVTSIRLTRMYQDAREAVDAREEVLRIVSHDLRNPLGTIAMAADLLLDLPTDERLKNQQLGIIKRAGDRMNRLIHDLLDVARMDAGRLPIEPRPVEVAGLLESVAEMMRPLAEEQKLQLRLEVPPALPDVQVDSERIVQVFSNLTGNAIKFTPAGGTITLSAERLGDRVRMSVADTGPGIPPEQLEQIFGHMWQARKDDRRGIGLGLTIARSIVEAHGEQIGVESQVGQGTTFWFTTPVVGAELPRTTA